jgi:hypothetical protein
VAEKEKAKLLEENKVSLFRDIFLIYTAPTGSVADPDPGRGAFLTPGPGSRIQNRYFWIPDLGSRIPTSYFLELSNKFLGKKFYNSLKTGPNFVFSI